MSDKFSSIQRPQRWDVPFGEKMTDAAARKLLDQEPFRSMNSAHFPAATPLIGILRNDTRLVTFQPGEIVLREGDYGNSAFLILEGALRVSLDPLPADYLGRASAPKKSWAQTIAQIWSGNKPAETRPPRSPPKSGKTATKTSEAGTAVFLQDVPGVLSRYHSLKLTRGEMFGELAAMSRTPRTATVYAEEEATLLEIRWQGLKLLRRDQKLQDHLDQLYRDNSLRVHLRQTPWLKNLPEADLAAVAEATKFESWGDFDWGSDYRQAASQDPNQNLTAEPLIAEEEHYANDLILIRSGFARLSQKQGTGHRTLSYLGKGQLFGLAEIAHHSVAAAGKTAPRPYQASLRALGYVDVLRIPAGITQKHILPHIRPSDLPPIRWLKNLDPAHVIKQSSAELPAGFVEFLVDQRLNNGTQAMVIDLDRCIRCDDCVRACAATHNNNPRFIRTGPKYEHFQFASACMHCADPVCMIGCPTGAIARHEESGTVSINDNTCIGCGTCATNCPYQNIQMVQIADPLGKLLVDEKTQKPILQATKCDLCQQQPAGPACQNACSHDALIRLNLTEITPLENWRGR